MLIIRHPCMATVGVTGLLGYWVKLTFGLSEYGHSSDALVDALEVQESFRKNRKLQRIRSQARLIAIVHEEADRLRAQCVHSNALS